MRVTLTSRERGGGGLRAVIGAGLAATAALAGYGVVRYPGLRSDGDAAIAAVTFVALLSPTARSRWRSPAGRAAGASPPGATACSEAR